MLKLLDDLKRFISVVFFIYAGTVISLLGFRFAYEFIISKPMNQWVCIWAALCFLGSFFCYRAWRML